ncbi:hypothetical protein M9H77_31644 [Catharanthus roseus]|uniref:Uncharacterized protein n=1 Tax=Catharanthus roseus TaxID=4058 RepID=A0ACC0A1Y2_CATRO|nr:hypothetical protein M9H77_31644 [Catharanthus roseus]
MQELQSLRDEMRDIRRDVTNLSNQQREFHQPPHFDEELYPPPYGGRRSGFGGIGMPRHFEEVPRPQARHGKPLYDDHEHIPFVVNRGRDQAQAPTPFGEESSNSQHDDPLRLMMQELQSLRDEMRGIRRVSLISLINKRRLVLMVVSMLLPQGAMDHSIALGQPNSTNLHILMKSFIHLLTVVEKTILEEEACLDTLKKFQNHKLGMESHYMMIMNLGGMMRSSFPNQRQVSTTKPPTSNFKPWPKKEEAPKGTFQPPTKPKMKDRGHYASSCLTKRALIFREDLNSWIEKEEDESSECVEGEENSEDDEHVDLNPIESDDDVLSLVTIRALSAQAFDDNMIEQRENIFHSKCKVEGRIANLIIDSSSCVNVSSAYLVEKLKLPTTKHDKPYKLHWLNDSGEIKVLRQVVVPIEMGAYKDEYYVMWCPCKHAIFSWEDLGNSIESPSTMGRKILILL